MLVLCSSDDNSGETKALPDVRVTQPRGPIYVRTGDLLTLECEVTSHVQAGPVRWFKGEDDSRKLIFPAYGPNKRVTRREKGSDTDFTIIIHNVVPEDAGIYYCVKRKGKYGARGEDLQSGPGTEVLVDNIQVQQPRRHIYVRTGDNLTLECEVTAGFRAGPVKWYKGEGIGRKLVFSPYPSFERVTRRDKESNTDFTIVIHNIVPEDAGIYYCVKQNKKSGGSGEDLKSGPGTEVFVDSEWNLISF
uniref:Uncharacterized protein n=1 Tax=Sphaerodactylus townsendi TaxID=933632 RepID=A0ACB8F7T8_9SAUR